MATLAMVLAFLILGFLTSAGMLWLSARVVRVGYPSFKRALACATVLTLVGIALQIIGVQAPFPSSIAGQLIIGAVFLLLCLWLTWAIIARVLGTTFGQSMLLSFPYFMASIPWVIGTVYVLKTYCMEAFFIPTNSMAPTFFGWHHEAVCPLCQGKVIIPGRPPNDPDRFLEFPGQAKNGICTQCRKISEFTKWSEEVHTPIRIICNKLMQPQRGDAIVFVYPGNPDPQQKTLYVMRLVGLPGEKIEIKDEAVWINGDKWSPPPELSGLAYTGRPGFLFDDDLAKEPRSWDLGPDDFFVLGDLTTNSSDSREWGPVPRANLVGVATLIYWPPSAWRVLR